MSESSPLFGDSRLPDELDARVRAELSSGEQLLWASQPQPRRFARSSWPIVLFGIPWTAFAIFWVAMASGMMFWGGGGPPGDFNWFFSCFPLFGVPFILIGLGMLTAPYWAMQKAKRTCYALTDRRAILWEAGWFGSVEVRSYGPKDLGKIRRVEYGDGGGDLIFEEFVTIGRDSEGNRTTTTTRHGFMGIDRVRDLEELVRKALLSEQP